MDHAIQTEMLRQMREQAKAAFADETDIAVRDQALATWRDRLTATGLELTDATAVLGILVGLKMACWAVEALLDGKHHLHDLSYELQCDLAGGQMLVLNMDSEPFTMPDPDTQEGV